MAIALVLVAGAVAGYRAWSAQPRAVTLSRVVSHGKAQGYNVLLVTLDTVRSDHLGCYGDKAAETPNLDGLAAHGVRFDHAVTAAPITMPSHATMLTGLYPPRHGVLDNGLFALAGEHETLAEELKGQGYDTAAFLGCFVLDERFGLSQGFDTYDFRVAQDGFFPSNIDMNQRSAADVSDAAIGWLGARESSKPFLMWVHYFDAHVPYQSPLMRLPRFADRPYDAEIAYVDQELGRLLAALDARGLRDRTLVVVASDHGESLGEHGESTHGLFLYDGTLRVAFLLSSPGLFHAPLHVAERIASLADLRPTVEDLLGLPVAPGLDGVSLLRDDLPADRAVYSETHMAYYAAGCSPLYAMSTLRDKYVQGPEPEFYDLAADSAETRNLVDTHPPRADALRAELAELQRSWGGTGTGAVGATRGLSAEEAERLESLGYVHGAAPDSGVAGESLPDPKAMVRASRRLTAALRLIKENRLEEALREAQAASGECPGYLDATLMRSDLNERLQRPDESVRILQESLAQKPTAGAALALARLSMISRRYDRMEEALAIVGRLDPRNGFIHILRGDRDAQEGRWDAARAEYETALKIDENRVGMIVRPQLEKIRGRVGGGGPLLESAVRPN